MLDWIRRAIERRREKAKLNRPIAFSGDDAFVDGGRISVDPSRILKSPKFQEQLQAVRDLAANGEFELFC